MPSGLPHWSRAGALWEGDTASTLRPTTRPANSLHVTWTFFRDSPSGNSPSSSTQRVCPSVHRFTTVALPLSRDSHKHSFRWCPAPATAKAIPTAKIIAATRKATFRGTLYFMAQNRACPNVCYSHSEFGGGKGARPLLGASLRPARAPHRLRQAARRSRKVSI